MKEEYVDPEKSAKYYKSDISLGWMIPFAIVLGLLLGGLMFS